MLLCNFDFLRYFAWVVYFAWVNFALGNFAWARKRGMTNSACLGSGYTNKGNYQLGCIGFEHFESGTGPRFHCSGYFVGCSSDYFDGFDNLEYCYNFRHLSVYSEPVEQGYKYTVGLTPVHQIDYEPSVVGLDHNNWTRFWEQIGRRVIFA